MARVTAYQATDSKLFTDRKAYIQHQTDVNATQDLEKLAVDAGQSPEVTAFLVANLVALREILVRRFNPSEKADAGETGAGDAASGAAGAPAAPGAADSAEI